ncbi:helix-turn-helix domain-containing protein [Clostridium botulinum]|uniref:helix-turn-helix domain-containing protein n=1 Tax=Clostridium botulinum TaxID=1491 RepID=UPI00174B12E9|nr:helix-turn-helix domain-containing protein [Clostridium botulinum]MBD5642761.1 helix-turn-helix domain-containing protein [Clostridium botulinum]
MSNVITQQQSDMITMLIEGHSITDIAKKLNITRNTVYAWMKKDHISAEMDRRKQELKNQGNSIILKDVHSYIGNIKDLANNSTDNRVKLAANQYMLNRIYGNPTCTTEDNNSENNDNLNENELEKELNELTKIRRIK